jgi:integrase
MSENTIRVALRSMGYGNDDMTAHGFRGMASTALNEHGFPVDVIERQLAHLERDSVRAAYNHAEYLPQRREMMQWWADFLDELKNAGSAPK